MKVISEAPNEYSKAIRSGVVTVAEVWRELTLIRDFTFLKHVQVVRLKTGNLSIELNLVDEKERVAFAHTTGPYGHTLDYVRTRVNPRMFSDKFVLVNARIRIYLDNSSLDEISILERANGVDSDQVIRKISSDISKLLFVTSKKK